MAREKSDSTPITSQQEYMIALEVSGTAPLIQSAFAQKTIEDMLRKHMGFAVHREPKRPRELIERATIRNMNKKICIPPMAFKKGMLTASIPIKDLKKTQLRPTIWIEGSSIPIKYDEMIPRMDMVRLAGMTRTPDVRFRPSFINWSARMIIGFNESLQAETIVELLNRAGRIGVGEWRPERDGTFGTYKVTRNITAKKEIDKVREECSSQLTPLIIPDWAMDVELSPDVMRKIAASGTNHGEEDENIENVSTEVYKDKKASKKKASKKAKKKASKRSRAA